MIIIGIGHRSNHGKDTLANYLLDSLKLILPEKKILKVSWAMKLKQVSHELYGHLGLHEGDFYETEEGRLLRNVKLPKIDLSPVEIWIKVGSRAIRDQVWDKTWVEWVVNNIQADILINADTRFPLEIGYCNYKIKCINPRIPNRTGESVDDELADYDGWDWIVTNSGSKRDLGMEAIKLSRWIYSGLLASGKAGF